MSKQSEFIKDISKSIDEAIYTGDKGILESIKTVMPLIPEEMMDKINGELTMMSLLGNKYQSQYQIEINKIL